MRSRRLEYSESTRDALVDNAVRLFTERGYAATSLDEVARQSRVTKGALYHHFTGKQALFAAAFDRVEHDTMTRLAEILGSPSGEVWDAVMEGLRQFIKICQEPAYQRIVLQEGPAVLGWGTWRKTDEKYSYGVVRAGVAALLDAGEIIDLPLETTSRLLFGALWNGAMMIAEAPDPREAGTEVFTTIVKLLEGHRRRPTARPDAATG